MAADDLPVLIAGDVHGDIERLFQAVKPYPSEQWHTVFLGDLVDYGMFGVGALRFARDRPNTDVLLGNHEVAMLWALRDSSRVGFWMSIGGQRHDLDELRLDESLQRWMRQAGSLARADAVPPRRVRTQAASRLQADGLSRWQGHQLRRRPFALPPSLPERGADRRECRTAAALG